MLGITDPWILMAYLLCIISTLACVVYGILNWNKGAEDNPSRIKKDVLWESDESKINESL